MPEKIVSHTDLEVYRRSFAAAMRLFELSKQFPREEVYSLTDQIRRSSRSVSANLAEAWRKRRHVAAFISKLSDAEGEAAETQVWLAYALGCGYLSSQDASDLHEEYESILRTLVGMAAHPASWTFPSPAGRPRT